LCRKPVRISHVAREDDGGIREGSLLCTNSACQREHPIIDGIPVLLADASTWLTQQMLGVLRRQDLSPFLESLLGDLAGAPNAYDYERGNLSIYADSHWSPQAPSYLTLFTAVAPWLQATGPSLDLGCSLGRGTMELARHTGQLAVGVDLNFSMLRLAEKIRVGLVFDEVADTMPDYPVGNVTYWCADVANLPFANQAFPQVLCANLLDCVASPYGLLQEITRLLPAGGQCLLTTPFDWAAGATPPGAWIGGHSQRSTPGEGSSREMFRYLLEHAKLGLEIAAERDDTTWRLRVHERSTTEYQVYCALLARPA
jgi:SAM-dependent methyltransferase/uncharacterized protein YbaR (Trm112 family)